MSSDNQPEILQFQTEVKQLLHLVTHSLYSNKEIFLRELISNASDAADKLRFEALANNSLYEDQAHLKIWITVDKSANTLTVKDNGIGMSRQEVIDNLGTIAKSGTGEFLARLTGDQKKDANLIGQFGVGFYSAFVVADKVTVKTRMAGCAANLGVCWESSGAGEYTICHENIAERGTEVILHLKDSEQDFLEPWRLRTIVKKYSDHLNIPIFMHKLEGIDEQNSGDEVVWEQVNCSTALWLLPKNDITNSQYCEFYKHITHDFQDPLLWSHNNVEGANLEYISLLYIPQQAQFDMLQSDKYYGLKLYVQRVFIMDHVEQFMPNYLRFIRGVIDTNSLPLNVSRELLQDHAVVGKLRAALTKRVLDMLHDLSTDQDSQKYQNFWKQFGNFLKTGVGEDFANRDRLLELLRFASSSSLNSEQTVSLADYLGRMPEKQNKIYYILAENFHAGRSSPHMEIFQKHKIEVLILSDNIDFWFIDHCPSSYKDKLFQDITKGDLSLEEITEAGNSELNPPEEKPADDFENVIKKMNEVLNSEVKEIRLSHRLTSSPACLVREKHEIGPQLHRLLKSVGKEVEVGKPILEINPAHKLIEQLNSVIDTIEFADWARLIYEQAVLAEGGQLKDPAAFVKRINNLWISMI